MELSRILGRKITTRTIKDSWLNAKDCPFPRGRGPILKEPVIAWARTRPLAPSSPMMPVSRTYVPPPESPADKLRRLKLEEELKALQRKNAEKDSLSIPADEARAAINWALSRFKHELLEELPPEIWTACQRTPIEVAVVAIRKYLTDAINRFAEAASAPLNKSDPQKIS